MHRNEVAFTNAGIDHVAVHIAEWQLLILLKIVGYYERSEIMYFNKRTKAHTWIRKLVLFKMLHHKRHFQELMKLRKSEHVNGNE